MTRPTMKELQQDYQNDLTFSNMGEKKQAMDRAIEEEDEDNYDREAFYEQYEK